MIKFGGCSKNFAQVVAGLTLAPSVILVAQAKTFLTEEQVAQEFFPNIKLTQQSVRLIPEQVKVIQKMSGERVLDPLVRVWWGPEKQAVIVDEVVGKHEFITYAVAISSAGEVVGIEIMDYKETYGYEVCRSQWRKQFVGKTSKSALRLEKDIANISGATLSSSHVTNGVRRVLQTFEVLKSQS